MNSFNEALNSGGRILWNRTGRTEDNVAIQKNA